MILGGPIFALLMIWVGLAGLDEFQRLAHRDRPPMIHRLLGFVVIAGLGIAGLAGVSTVMVFGLIGLAVYTPLLAALADPPHARPFTRAALTTTGSLLLGLPVLAAIGIRGGGGSSEQPWLTDLSQLAALAWPSTPRGLAWVGLVVLAIWVGDSAAYLVGRAIGRRPLAPAISPRKTVEGSIAGLAGSAATGLVCGMAFGLGVSLVAGLAIGAAVGALAQLGDLVESWLKRQAGVKDSGTLIPGHGGVLDRVDALLLAFPVAWLVIALIDGPRP